ncbi:hypothetical protein FHX76_003156 [Lysinibacter cavernae]|uniref:Ig-like domain-containing protein n=2 Tax=Lysinibacter cavernae TaxID=1640652 RepID=A0A7X5R461_9MICO|nr:hypothetical protein [Lysinibacter cavernae]
MKLTLVAAAAAALIIALAPVTAASAVDKGGSDSNAVEQLDTSPEQAVPSTGANQSTTDVGESKPKLSEPAEPAEPQATEPPADRVPDEPSVAGAETAVADSVVAAPRPVENAVFRWGINNESSGGSYFGGCNFLSAGIAGDAGGSQVWGEKNGLSRFYSPEQGNVSILKPDASGALTISPTWATKCHTPEGVSVNGKTSNAADSYTRSIVQLTNGTGTVDPVAGTASIQWKGSFTVAYYGGMTYWSVTDPVLTVAANGIGTVTAIFSGYGADMDDASVWNSIPTRTATLATLSGVTITENGFTVTPDFLGVAADTAGRNPQAAKTSANAAWWGSFPREFNDYQMLTGQSSYWYTTDGGANSLQPRKATLPLSLTFEDIVTEAPSVVTQPRSQTASDWATVTFDTQFSGGPGLDYAWQRSSDGSTWTPVQGGSTASLTVTAQLDNTGDRYRVIATNELGSATSEAAALTVGPKRPGSIVPRVTPEAIEGSTLTTRADIATKAAAGTVTDATARATGVAVPLDTAGTLSVSVPWASAAAGEVWVYPGQRYLGSFTVSKGNAVFQHDAGDLLPDTGYSLVFFNHTDPLVTVSFTTAPASTTPVDVERTVSNAGFRWGINNEANGGAYFGGCNFLSAGTAGNTGASRVWSQADGFYSASSSNGNVRLEKPTAAGTWEAPTWGTKCLDRTGAAVTSNSTTSTTNTELVFTAGTGVVDPSTNSASISWKGSFTVAFYGGMTYWTATNPVLTVTDGVGTLTAIGSGYAADMDDASVWRELSPRMVTLGTLRGITVTHAGFTVSPEYVGVKNSLGGGRYDQAPRTAENSAFWGSFPSDFVAFQIETGQSAYWYTSDGARDRAKIPVPLTVCFDMSNCAGTIPPAVETLSSALTQTALTPPTPTPKTKAPIASVTQAAAGAAQGVTTIQRTVLTTRVLQADPPSSAELIMTLFALLAGLGALTVVTAAAGGLVASGVISFGGPTATVTHTLIPPLS